jgi:hypothetical protein
MPWCGGGRVVVQLVFGQDGAQVCLAEDQHAVEELAAQGADGAFAGRVGPGRRCAGSWRRWPGRRR